MCVRYVCGVCGACKELSSRLRALVAYSTNFGPQDQLTIGLWDKDRFSHDDFLGQVVLRYEDLTDGCRRWWGLQSRPGVGDRNINGELYLHIRLPR